jgi:hypothetical protein
MCGLSVLSWLTHILAKCFASQRSLQDQHHVRSISADNGHRGAHEERVMVTAAIDQALSEERQAQEARNGRVLEILQQKDAAIAECQAREHELETQVWHCCFI